MRLITGDECGLMKESIPELSRTNDPDGKQTLAQVGVGVSRIGDDGLDMNRSRGIVDMAFCEIQSNDDASAGSLNFCALRANGSLEKWEGFAPYKSKEDRICGGTYKLSQSLENIFEDEKSMNDDQVYLGRPIAMTSPHQYQTFTDSKANNVLACCTSTGRVSIVNANKFDKGVVAQYEAYSNGKMSNPTKISYTRGQFQNRDIATAMTMSVDGNRIVIGGRERAATMLDVESGKNVWKAKNLPPNPQTLLQQPIWATAMQYLSKTDTLEIGGSKDLLAIGTAYKQLQIYDVRSDATQRRPVLYTPEWDSTKENLLEHRVTSLCQLDANKIVVGDSAGCMHTLDMRKISNKHGRSTQASVGRYAGPAGSVRQIVKHETLPIIACVGLDRMLRTFDIAKRTQLDCVYLKQRLNCMLFCSDGTWNTKQGEDGEESDSNESGSDTGSESEGDMDDEDIVQDYIDSSDDDEDSEQEDAQPVKKRRK